MKRAALPLIVLSTVLAGCSSGGGSGSAANSRLAGMVQKGIITDAGVLAEEILANGTRVVRGSAETGLAGVAIVDNPCTQTPGAGQYCLTLADYNGGPLILSVLPKSATGDVGTSQMRCDSASGCGSTSAGNRLTIHPNFRLQALLPNVNPVGDTTANISAITHLSLIRAEELSTQRLRDIDRDIASEAVNEVAQLFGGLDSLSIQLIDLNDTQAVSNARPDALAYAAINAGITQLAFSQGGGSNTTDDELIRGLTQLRGNFVDGMYPSTSGSFSAQNIANAAETAFQTFANGPQIACPGGSVSSRDASPALCSLRAAIANAGAADIDPIASGAASNRFINRARGEINNLAPFADVLMAADRPADILATELALIERVELPFNDFSIMNTLAELVIDAYDCSLRADADANLTECDSTTTQHNGNDVVLRQLITRETTNGNTAISIQTVGQINDLVVDMNHGTFTISNNQSNPDSISSELSVLDFNTVDRTTNISFNNLSTISLSATGELQSATSPVQMNILQTLFNNNVSSLIAVDQNNNNKVTYFGSVTGWFSNHCNGTSELIGSNQLGLICTGSSALTEGNSCNPALPEFDRVFSATSGVVTSVGEDQTTTLSGFCDTEDRIKVRNTTLDTGVEAWPTGTIVHVLIDRKDDTSDGQDGDSETLTYSPANQSVGIQISISSNRQEGSARNLSALLVQGEVEQTRLRLQRPRTDQDTGDTAQVIINGNTVGQVEYRGTEPTNFNAPRRKSFLRFDDGTFRSLN